MIFYVIHSDAKKEKEITHDLQVKDFANCYICPSCAFSHLEEDGINLEYMRELHYDLLSCVDKIIVVGKVFDKMKSDIDFANLVKMEIEYLD